MPGADEMRAAAATTAGVQPTTSSTPAEVDPTTFRQAGEIVGNYRIKRLLARGGLSEVYLGENQVTETIVAIKVLARPLENRADLQKRLRVEAQIGEALAHPNIVRMKDAGMTPDHRLYIVMDYVPGRTLREQLELSPDRRLDFEGSLHIMLQITNGIRFAHRKGIYHRDLKPENVMVLPDGDAKIVDFGIAKFTQRSDDSQDMPKLGTPRYLSPEQIRNEHADGRADIYALGVMLYEVYGGRHPFELPTESATAVEMIARHLSAELPELLPDYPEAALAVWRVVSKCLAKDPRERWATADELLEALCELARLSVLPEHPDAVRISHVVKLARARQTEAAAATRTEGGRAQPATEEPDTSTSRPPVLPDAFSDLDATASASGDADAQRRTEPLVQYAQRTPVLPFAAPARPLMGVGHTMRLVAANVPAGPEPRSVFAPAHGELTPTSGDAPPRAPPGAPHAPPRAPSSKAAPPKNAAPVKPMRTQAQPRPSSNASIIVLAVACGAMLSAGAAVFGRMVRAPAGHPPPMAVTAAPSGDGTGDAPPRPSAGTPAGEPSIEVPPVTSPASAEPSSTAAPSASAPASETPAPSASAVMQPAALAAAATATAAQPEAPTPTAAPTPAPTPTAAPNVSSGTRATRARQRSAAPTPAARPAASTPPRSSHPLFEVLE
jgi:serine/threonine protein kinase